MQPDFPCSQIQCALYYASTCPALLNLQHILPSCAACRGLCFLHLIFSSLQHLLGNIYVLKIAVGLYRVLDLAVKTINLDALFHRHCLECRNLYAFLAVNQGAHPLILFHQLCLHRDYNFLGASALRSWAWISDWLHAGYKGNPRETLCDN